MFDPGFGHLVSAPLIHKQRKYHEDYNNVTTTEMTKRNCQKKEGENPSNET